MNNIWLNNVVKEKSPNFDQRKAKDIDLLVIHNISLPAKQFGGTYIVDLFLNKLDISADPSFKSLDGLKVSAHFLINRVGQITQFVALNKRAWHAGVSSFEEREGCNEYSIGIELEGADDILYTDLQYQQLVLLTQQIIKLYPKITVQRIVGHSDIAPNRKTDPGESFDWVRYKKALLT